MRLRYLNLNILNFKGNVNEDMNSSTSSNNQLYSVNKLRELPTILI